MFVNIGMNPIFIDRKAIKTDTIGATAIGINNKGLKITGSPKIKGSLMLKNAGTNEIFDMMGIIFAGTMSYKLAESYEMDRLTSLILGIVAYVVVLPKELT